MKKDRKRFSFTVFFSIIIFFSLIVVAIFIKKDTLCNETGDVNSSSYWDGSVASSFSEGIGTESNPYKINSASEFALMMESCNANTYFDIQTNIFLNKGHFEYSNGDYLYDSSEHVVYVNIRNGKTYDDAALTNEGASLNITTPISNGQCTINGNRHQIVGLYNNSGVGFANNFNGKISNLLFVNSLIAGTQDASIINHLDEDSILEKVSFDGIITGNKAAPFNEADGSEINAVRVTGNIIGNAAASGLITTADSVSLNNIELSADLISQQESSGFINTLSYPNESSIRTSFYNGKVKSNNFNAYVTNIPRGDGITLSTFIYDSFVTANDSEVDNSYIITNDSQYNNINLYFDNSYQNIYSYLEGSQKIAYTTKDLLLNSTFIANNFDNNIWHFINNDYPKLKIFNENETSSTKLSVTSLFYNNSQIENDTKDYSKEYVYNNSGNSNPCHLISGSANTVGAIYSCTFADGVAREFYYIGLNDTDPSKIDLLMTQNYIDDYIPSKVPWCDPSTSSLPNNCQSDGLARYNNYLINKFGLDVGIKLFNWYGICTMGGCPTWLSPSGGSFWNQDASIVNCNSSSCNGGWSNTIQLVGTVQEFATNGYRPVVIVDKPLETITLGDSCTLVSGTHKTLGAKYSCTFADGVARDYYILSANSNKYDLIAAQNFNEFGSNLPTSTSWCLGSDTCTNHNGLNHYITYIQNIYGSSVEVSLPTYEQLSSSGCGSSTDSCPLWIKGNIQGDEFAYYTSSLVDPNSTNQGAYVVVLTMRFLSGYQVDSMVPISSIGIRPVVSINDGTSSEDGEDIYPLDKIDIKIEANGDIPLSYIGYYLSEQELDFDEIDYHYYTGTINFDEVFEGYIYVKTIDAMNNVNYIISNKIHMEKNEYTVKDSTNTKIESTSVLSNYDKAIYHFTTYSSQTGTDYNYSLDIKNVPVGTIINMEYNGEYYAYEVLTSNGSISLNSFKKVGGPNQVAFNDFNPNNREFTFIFDYTNANISGNKIVSVNLLSKIDDIPRSYITTSTYQISLNNINIGLSQNINSITATLNGEYNISYNINYNNNNNILLRNGYYYLVLFLKNSNNNLINDGSFNGIAFEYDNKLYYADSDGYVTIPVSQKQTAYTIKMIVKNQSNKQLPGIYFIDAQLEITNGTIQVGSNHSSFPVSFDYFDYSEIYDRLNLSIDNAYRVITKGNGSVNIPVNNKNNIVDTKYENFKVSVVVSLYKKSNNSYNQIDLSRYTNNDWETFKENEYFYGYIYTSEYDDIILNTQSLSSGAYKWVFNYYYGQNSESLKTIEIPFIIK